MKKILSILMAICIVFAFSACGKEVGTGGSSIASLQEGSGFEKPDSYASVLKLKINPEFKLYLSVDGKVLALEAVNDDAKSIYDNIEFSGKGFEEVVENIVAAAKNGGFIKEDANISFEISEKADASVNAADIINRASASAKKAATELKIKLPVADDDETSSASSQTQTSSNSQAQTNSSSQPAQSGNAHTHSFSKATCTESAKCACGEVSGSPLGHKWQAATCVQRKTCTVCGRVEGELLPHRYVDGFCAVCKQFESINPKEHLKMNVEYIGYFRISGDTLLASAFMFDGDVCVLTDRIFSSTQTDPEQKPIVYKGKKYYSEGGGMEPFSYKLTDEYIDVTQSLYEESPEGTNLRVHLMKDGRLIVKSTRFIEYPAGTVYSTDINEVLK